MKFHWHVSVKDQNVPSQREAGGNAFVEDGEELQNPATNVVREAIQNSLDKRLDLSAPVVVRFTVTDMKPTVIERWLGHLLPHAASSWPRGLAKGEGRPRALVVEDFNTTGLGGDVAVASETEAAAGNDFFYFWRAQNMSAKAGQGGGSWGVGKTTYYLLSHIGAIIGSSIPVDPSSHATVMGRCHLTEHRVEGSDAVYQHFGYGCAPKEPSELALPLSDSEHLRAFAEDWSIKRTDEPGLSIVIPYLLSTLETSDLVRAVVEEYPYPLMAGDLRVIVADGAAETLIDASTVQEIAESAGLTPKAQKHLSLTRLLCTSSDPVELETQTSKSRPSAEMSEDIIDVARNQLEKNGFVHFRVPLGVTKSPPGRESVDRIDHIDVVLQESDEPSHFYVRSGLWVKGEPGQGVARPKNFDSLLVLQRPNQVGEPSIAELLGRFEGASHRTWDSATDDDRRPMQYQNANDIRRFVRRLPSELAKAMSLHSDQERFTLADDWFSTAATDRGAGGGNSTGASGGVPPKTPPASGRAVVEARLDPKDASRVMFSVTGSSTIFELRLRIAYEQQDHARTTNMDKWSPEDFILGLGNGGLPGVVQVLDSPGLKSYAEEVHENVITCRNVDPKDFGLSVAGLDRGRGIQWEAAAWDERGRSMRLTGGAA